MIARRREAGITGYEGDPTIGHPAMASHSHRSRAPLRRAPDRPGSPQNDATTSAAELAGADRRRTELPEPEGDRWRQETPGAGTLAATTSAHASPMADNRPP